MGVKMLYKLYKGKFTRCVQYAAKYNDVARLFRSAANYKTKIKLIKLFDIKMHDFIRDEDIKTGTFYIVRIEGNFLMFKLRAWLFNRKIAKMKEMHKKGMTYRQIAKKFGCTYQNVFYMVKKRN